MAETEFSVSGVHISAWPRSLTRAGTVVLGDGRVALLTSRGKEIDSAPLAAVRAAASLWIGAGRHVRLTLEGRRYRLRVGHQDGGALRRFLEVLAWAREQEGPTGDQGGSGRRR